MLLFEKSVAGRRGVSLPPDAFPEIKRAEIIPERFLRPLPPPLPELSQPDIVRHYTELSHKNLGVDNAFYPLGSCTMKFNPKINEDLARLEGFSQLHPYQPEPAVQGLLKLCFELGEMLKELTGLSGVSLQPAAGAHGELTSLLMVQAYFQTRGEKRTKIIIPDSAHGTNPASAARAGFQAIKVPSDKRGRVDLQELQKLVDQDTAMLMLTNPNTLGLFEENVAELSELMHRYGGFVYLDGANFNAFMAISRPGDWDIDIMHINLHKTFSTPHGGGGPGAGPIVCNQRLEPFLPLPVIVKKGEEYHLDYQRENSIGPIRSFIGQVAVAIKAYCYIVSLGAEGLCQVSRDAVLNANYLLSQLKGHYEVLYDDHCMHEFVLSAQRQKAHGVRALDIAKKLLDYGFHPPTVYFPLIVPEALMIEPTETEGKETLDAFIKAMQEIARLAEEDPESVQRAPEKMPVRRLDEYQAARHPITQWRDPKQ